MCSAVKDNLWLRGVFLLCVSLYALSIGRGFYGSDGEVMFLTTAALVERGALALDPDPALPQIVAGSDGHFYSKYNPGLSLLMVPFYVTGDWIAAVNAAHRYRVAALAVLLLPVLAGAVAVTGVARLALRIGDARHAVVIALAAGIASPLWWYARVLFAEAVLAAVLVSAVGLVWDECERNPPHARQVKGAIRVGAGRGGFRNPPLRALAQRIVAVFACFCQRLQGRLRPFRTIAGVLQAPAGHANHTIPAYPEAYRADCNPPLRGVPKRRVFLAGIVFGVGIAVRAAFAIYAPALVWLIVRGWARQTWRARAQQVGVFAAGMLPGIALVLWHNALRFGAPFTFGYAGEGFTAPVWKGAAGLLISPGKGALVIAPPLIVALLLGVRLWRTAPALAEFLALAWGAALVVYGAWWAWDGGWCWGPRFVVPLIPLSMLSLAVLPDVRGWRWALGITLFAGVALNGAAVLVDVVPQYAAVAGSAAADVDRINWTLRDGLPAAVFARLLRGETEPLAWFHLQNTGLPVTWTVGGPVLLGAGVVLGLWLIWRGLLRFTD